MSKNPIIEMSCCEGWYQESGHDGRSRWRLHRFVNIRRANGYFKEWGNRGYWDDDGSFLREGPPLANHKFQRVLKLYRRLKRRKNNSGFELDMDYRPPVWHRRNQAYYFFTIKRK